MESFPIPKRSVGIQQLNTLCARVQAVVKRTGSRRTPEDTPLTRARTA